METFVALYLALCVVFYMGESMEGRTTIVVECGGFLTSVSYGWLVGNISPLPYIQRD